MRKENKWALGAVIAVGIGFVAGILTAPRSGQQTRKKLAQSASKARVDGEKQLKQLHSDLQNLIKEGEVKLKSSKEKRSSSKTTCWRKPILNLKNSWRIQKRPNKKLK